MNTKARVPSAQTGDSRSDGGTTGITMPEAGGRNALTEAGRHFKNSRTANVGTFRGGQSEPAGNWPVTGVPPSAPIRSMAPRPTTEVWTDAAQTSKSAEKLITGPPTPFNVEGGSATLYPGSVKFAEVGIGYEYISDPDAPLSSRGYGVRPMSKSEMEAAASVDGMPSSSGVNSINSGYPTRGTERQAGRPGSRNTNTSARENSRMRQE